MNVYVSSLIKKDDLTDCERLEKTRLNYDKDYYIQEIDGTQVYYTQTHLP